jgi:hypothetical protein
MHFYQTVLKCDSQAKWRTYYKNPSYLHGKLFCISFVCLGLFRFE